jgi:serine/threonine-protein kinase ATR
MLLCVLLILFGILDFSLRHGVIFETIGSLLSLLRSGARDAYRQFFVDSMLVVEGNKKFILNSFF